VEVAVGAEFGWAEENTPPPTLDGVVEFVELDAASAYAASVSPLSLSTVSTYSTYRICEARDSIRKERHRRDIRRVHNPYYTQLTMHVLASIEPDWIRIINRYDNDGRR
jgi:hypothetical protein